MSEDPFRIVTPEFRGSFVRLLKPRAINDGEPRYGLTIVLPKEDPFWAKLKKLSIAAAEEKFGKLPKKLVRTVKDGDDEDDGREEWEGCYAVEAATTDKPQVIGMDGEAIIDQSELYSGAVYQATIRVAAWFHKGSNRRGVSVYLQNVLKVRDGEPLGGSRTSALDDFADLLDQGGDDDPMS